MDKPNKLPPMPDESFDGEKHKSEVGLKARCNHKDSVTYVGNSRIQCGRCGNGWEGPNIGELLGMFKSV